MIYPWCTSDLSMIYFDLPMTYLWLTLIYLWFTLAWPMTYIWFTSDLPRTSRFLPGAPASTQSRGANGAGRPRRAGAGAATAVAMVAHPGLGRVMEIYGWYSDLLRNIMEFIILHEWYLGMIYSYIGWSFTLEIYFFFWRTYITLDDCNHQKTYIFHSGIFHWMILDDILNMFEDNWMILDDWWVWSWFLLGLMLI